MAASRRRLHQVGGEIVREGAYRDPTGRNPQEPGGQCGGRGDWRILHYDGKLRAHTEREVC